MLVLSIMAGPNTSTEEALGCFRFVLSEGQDTIELLALSVMNELETITRSDTPVSPRSKLLMDLVLKAVGGSFKVSLDMGAALELFQPRFPFPSQEEKLAYREQIEVHLEERERKLTAAAHPVPIASEDQEVKEEGKDSGPLRASELQVSTPDDSRSDASLWMREIGAKSTTSIIKQALSNSYGSASDLD